MDERLRNEGLTDNPVFLELAAFSFLDLEMTPPELDKRGERAAAFHAASRWGWVQENSGKLEHPGIAERVLRARGYLSVENQGAPVGEILADVLIRSRAPRAQLAQRFSEIRRLVRHGRLPDAQALLRAFYDRLLERQEEHEIPLDLLHIDRGSEFRRLTRLEDAENEFEKVQAEYRGALWRYERAYVSFMRGTRDELTKAENVLIPDLSGELSDDAFINRGLYAKILARQGRLREAYTLLSDLYKFKESFLHARPDARRWVDNVIAHLHEMAAGLAAHEELSREDLHNCFQESQETSCCI